MALPRPGSLNKSKKQSKYVLSSNSLPAENYPCQHRSYQGRQATPFPSLPIICPAGFSELKISCPFSSHDSWALTHSSPGDGLPGCWIWFYFLLVHFWSERAGISDFSLKCYLYFLGDWICRCRRPEWFGTSGFPTWLSVTEMIHQKGK